MNTITFTLPLNASNDDVQAVIVAIHNVFGVAAPVAKVKPVVTAVQVAADEDAASNDDDNGVLDVDGLPWDERIHSTSKAKTKEGKWRIRKNLDKDMLKTVTAQLKGTMQATAPVQITHSEPAPATPAAPAVPDFTPVVDSPFVQFATFIAENSAPNGPLSPEWVQQCLTNYGVPGGDLQNLAHRPDLIPVIHSAIKSSVDAWRANQPGA